MLINSNNNSLFTAHTVPTFFSVMVNTATSTENLEIYHTILQVATNVIAIASDGVTTIATLLFSKDWNGENWYSDEDLFHRQQCL